MTEEFRPDASRAISAFMNVIAKVYVDEGIDRGFRKALKIHHPRAN